MDPSDLRVPKESEPAFRLLLLNLYRKARHDGIPRDKIRQIVIDTWTISTLPG